MRTWQCFLKLQTRLAYGDHAGVDSPYSEAIQSEARRLIAAHSPDRRSSSGPAAGRSGPRETATSARSVRPPTSSVGVGLLGFIGAPQVIEKLFNQASSCSRPNSCRS